MSARHRKLLLLDILLHKNATHEHFDDGSDRRYFLMSCAYGLCHEFVCFARKLDYQSERISIVLVVHDVFSSVVHDITDLKSRRVQETLYYISGWTVCASQNVAKRRSKDVAEVFTYLSNFVSVNANFGKSDGLPTGKVDTVCAFGSLVYVLQQYFNFIVRIEEVFARVLAYEYLIVYGSFLLNKIKQTLLQDKFVFD